MIVLNLLLLIDITLKGLAEAVGLYLKSEKAENLVLSALEARGDNTSIHVSTAQRWLKKIGIGI